MEPIGKKTNKKEVVVSIDLSQKKWLNITEAIKYVGFGCKTSFRQFREKGLLSFYKPTNEIIYKRADLDTFVERFRTEAFKHGEKCE